ncbi:hypothetical protein AB1286_11910 [Trinickia sp. NRRL B-1857]|uniref:hypothetical protein n=1 Tax=Trinickia sp. NRRL B-1857 TaxID=3162879 RepID=UPI003D27D54B
MSFGTGLLLAVIVGAFAGYMTVTERVDYEAGDRASATGRPSPMLDGAGNAVPADPATTRVPLSSALMPLLSEQIANAHADGEADAARLRREHASRRQTRVGHSIASPPRAKAAPAARQLPSQSQPSRAHPAETRPASVAAPGAVTPFSPASAPSTPEQAGKSDATPVELATSDAISADRDTTRQPEPSADKSFSGQIERPAPPAQSDPQPPDAPPPVTQPEILRPNEPPSVSRQAPSAGVQHARAHTVRRGAANRRRHPPRAASVHAPAIVFTLPRLLIAPLMRIPVFPHAPSRAFDLSDNQRSLYRGH